MKTKKLVALVSIAALTLTLVGCGSTECPPQKTDTELKAEGWLKQADLAGLGWVKESDLAGLGYSKPVALPAPQKAGCPAGDEYKTSCSSILEADNLKDYLDRKEVVYIDLRDPASYLLGHVEGFELLPFFNTIYTANATVATAETLFYGTEFAPTFEESKTLLKTLVPTNRTIFLMCQSGGRVVSMMHIMESAGYDMTKVYNVGGWNKVSKDKLPVSESIAHNYTITLKLDDLTRKA